MSLRIQLIIAAAIVIILIIIFSMIRNNIIDLKYALIWLTVGTMILFLDLFPQLMEVMAAYLGVDLPINMLFFFGFCFSLLIIFVITIILSVLSRKVKRLTQEIALLNKKIESLQERMEAE